MIECKSLIIQHLMTAKLFIGSNNKKVRVWDVDNNKIIQSFNGYPDFVTCVIKSKNHEQIKKNK
ncbi:hypothetical protein RFI_36454 [Reticulomyxa filosa]|uniref:Uncharacterized protein n=1 Tax=Reticulomyxa filosa TaxID=46433 RepID=X6LI12_RETFI|nr:hypothetical protein RFI_36454 [Reticulomyxa filosa]|eukprot:ETO00986.1 hypothetical protein RFI_36454 [Reticulomyxa filosa]